MKTEQLKIIRFRLFFSLIITLLIFSLSVSGQSVVVYKGMKKGVGKFEADIIQGKSFGTKINMGKKTVKLTGLKMTLTEDYPSDLVFVIKIYPVHNMRISQVGVMRTETFTVKPRNKEVCVDLSEENLVVNDTVLLSVEWLETELSNKKLVLGSGFSRKGVYLKDGPEEEWKKIPLFGLNMEVLGEQVGN